MDSHLSKLSSIARVLIGGLSIVLPHLVVDSTLFGNYAISLSTALILGYFLELGVGLTSMATKSTAKEKQHHLIRLALIRDVLLILLIAGAVFFTDFDHTILLASALTASIVSWQGLLRANRDSFAEFISNLGILAGICIAYLYAIQTEPNNSKTLILLFVILPRAAGLVLSSISVFRLIFTTRGTATSRSSLAYTVQMSFPFWTQSMFASATSNIDILIAASIYGPIIAGSLKIVTTAINLCISPFEILYHYLMNEKANQRTKNLGILEKPSTKFVYACIIFIGTLVYLIFRPNSEALGFESYLYISIIVGGTVFLRALSLSIATYLSINGKQTTRVRVLVFTTCTYWMLIYLASHIAYKNAIFICILISAIIQFILYRKVLDRKPNELHL